MEKEKEKKKEGMMEIDSRAENPINTPPPPPPHLGCEYQNQSQTQVPQSRMMSLTSSSSSSGSSKQEVVLNPRRRLRRLCLPPRSRLSSSSPTSCSADLLLVGEGHRVSILEKIVRVLEKTHSSLRREYWSYPPTSHELRLHHLILIHVTSYISLFDIEQSDVGRALLPSSSSPTTQQQQQQQQQQGDDDDDDLEEMFDVLASKNLPVAFSPFLQAARKAACPRLEDDPLLKDTSTLKSMMEDKDNARNGEKKEQLLSILSDLEYIGRSRGYAPPLSGREIECYREIRNWAILSILFVFSSVILQSDALPPRDSFFLRCVPDDVADHFITHTPLDHLLSAGFEMIPFRRSFLDQCRRRISRILENEEEAEESAEEEDDDVVDADEADGHAE